MGSPTTKPPLRLAILEADTPLPGTAAAYQTYGNVFTSLFARALSPTTPVSSVLSIRAYNVVTSAATTETATYPDLDDLDAVLVTGSRHSAFADDPWIVALVEFVRRALDTGGRVRVVGVCFGHQIVGRALGVPVARGRNGWEVSVTEVRLSERGREVFGGSETLRIHQMHRDEVFSYPAGAEPLAETDVCPVQGMLIPGKAITVQGHPEFTEGIVREILESRHDVGILSDEIYKSGIERVADEHDGVAIAQAFLRFLRD